MVPHLAQLEVDQHEAAQDAVIENQVDLVMGVVDRHPILPADKREPLAKLQQEGLEVVAEHGFELGFGDLVGFGDFQELEHIGFAQQIGWLFDDLALLRQLQDACLVFAGSQPQEER